MHNPGLIAVHAIDKATGRQIRATLVTGEQVREGKAYTQRARAQGHFTVRQAMMRGWVSINDVRGRGLDLDDVFTW